MRESDPFDVEALRLSNGDNGAIPTSSPKRPPRHRQGEHFLKGPIPWPWLTSALTMPGRAVHVAMLLWKEAGFKNRRTVGFNLSRAAVLLKVCENTVRSSLKALKRAGLITVNLIPGERLEVTINEAPVTA